MVKGVNKTVIEISCTDNGYFERAILFVNPEQSHVSQKRLLSESQKYVELLRSGFQENISQNIKNSQKKVLPSRKIKTLIVTSAIAVATGIAFIILNFL